MIERFIFKITHEQPYGDGCEGHLTITADIPASSAPEALRIFNGEPDPEEAE